MKTDHDGIERATALFGETVVIDALGGSLGVVPRGARPSQSMTVA